MIELKISPESLPRLLPPTMGWDGNFLLAPSSAQRPRLWLKDTRFAPTIT